MSRRRASAHDETCQEVIGRWLSDERKAALLSRHVRELREGGGAKWMLDFLAQRQVEDLGTRIADAFVYMVMKDSLGVSDRSDSIRVGGSPMKNDDGANGWFFAEQMSLETERYKASLQYHEYIEYLEDEGIYSDMPTELDYEFAEEVVRRLRLDTTPSELMEENQKIIDEEQETVRWRRAEVLRQRELRKADGTPTFWELVVWAERGAPKGELPDLPQRRDASRA